MIEAAEEKIEEKTSEIVIRKYGLLDPKDWGPDCDEEMDRIDALWNRLVDIHELYLRKYHLEISKDLDLITAKIRYEKLNSGDIVPEIFAAAKKDLAVIQKDVTRRMTSELRALEMARREEVKVARQNSGLWWGNYNALVRAFERARSAAVRGGHTMRRRSSGGNGRITNTLPGGAALEHLFDGSLSQVKVDLPSASAWSAESRGERRRLQRTYLTATAFVKSGERRSVTWPMVMHRPIPADCRVKEVIITRRRFGNRWKWAVSFSCSREMKPSATAHQGTALIAVDIGWRRIPNGLRVATVMAADSAPDFVTLPQDLLDSFAFVDDLRDKVNTSARIGLELLKGIDAKSFEAPYQDLLSAFQQQQEAKFAGLKELCLSKFFTQQSKEVIGSDIYNWRAEYVKLVVWLSNHQRKVVTRRNHLYQNIAISVLKNASEVVLNDVKFGDIASRGLPRSDVGFFPRRANYYRIVAAPSELVRCLKLQAAKRGIVFNKKAAPTPVGCPHCGSTARKTRADALPQICDSCKTSFDQDVATCRWLLSTNGPIPTMSKNLNV